MVSGQAKAPTYLTKKVGNANEPANEPVKAKSSSRPSSCSSSGCFHCINCCSGFLSWGQVDSLRKMHGADKGNWGSYGHQTVKQYYEYYRNSQMTREKSFRPSWHSNQGSPLRARRSVEQLSLLIPATATNLSDTTNAHYVGPVGLPFKTTLMQAIAEESILSRKTSRQHVKENILVQVSSS